MTLNPRWVRLLPVAWLALLMPVRATDLLYTLDTTAGRSTATVVLGTAAIVSIFALTVMIVTERGSPRPLLALLAVLVFAPYLVIGSGWPEVGGLLCGAVLLTVRAPWSWVLFVGVAVADALVYASLVGHDLAIVLVNNASTDANIGLAIFAVTRLAQVVRETELTRRDLAATEAKIELADATSRLRTSVGVRLSSLIQQVHETLGRRTVRTGDVAEISAAARRAAGEARSELGAGRRTQATRAHTDPASVGVPFRFARWMLVGLLCCYAANAFSDAALLGGMTAETWWVLVLTTIAAAGLQLYHAAPRVGSGEPRGWRWTLAVQFVLAIPIPLGYPPLLRASNALSLAVSTAVIRLPPPWSWAFLGFAAFVGVPGLLVIDGYTPESFAAVISLVFTAFGFFIGALTMFALYALPVVTRELHESRDQLTHSVVAAERLRFARDVHDLLGFHLSAITLTCELASRAVDDDPRAARSHVQDLRQHAERALSEIRGIETSARLRLDAEIAAAREILRAAGVEISEDTPPDGMPAQADHLLGVIVRESVTNVIRHSSARHCGVTVRIDDNHVRVRVTNDGADAVPHLREGGGNGLDNLTARARAVGGTLTTVATGDTFEVTATVPLQAS